MCSVQYNKGPSFKIFCYTKFTKIINDKHNKFWLDPTVAAYFVLARGFGSPFLIYHG